MLDMLYQFSLSQDTSVLLPIIISGIAQNDGHVCSRGKTLAYSLFQLAEMLQQRFEVHLVLDAEAIPQVTTDTYAAES